MSVNRLTTKNMKVNSSIRPTITGKSLSSTEENASLPSPGQENTVSVTMAPVIKPAKTSEEKVRGAIIAFRNACFQSTAVELTP